MLVVRLGRSLATPGATEVSFMGRDSSYLAILILF